MMQKGLNNRTIFCKDNLEILDGMDSESIDLIYLDPPFNKNKKFTAPIGSSAEGASFDDIFKEEDVKDEWIKTIKEDHDELYHFLNGVKNVGNAYNYCYLCYMAIRLIELHRILKETGSIYLHCDPTMSHYLKVILDCIFGEKHFRNEIVWKRRGDKHNLATSHMGRSHDLILYYGKEKAQYRKVFMEYDQKTINMYKYNDGRGKYRLAPVVNRTGNLSYSFRGVKGHWRFKPETFEKKYQDNLIVKQKNGGYSYKIYWSDAEGAPLQDIWNDIPAVRKKKRYPTEKPLLLMERIIKASSNPGEIVLDPFCGCATTCVAAEKLDRQWIGIDVSAEAYNQVKEKLKEEVWLKKNIESWLKKGRTQADIDEILKKDIHFRTDPPQRSEDIDKHALKKYVYVISNDKYEGEYKVGIAKDWKSRLNTYQTADPNRKYKIEHKIHTHLFRELETFIHKTFENRHEWVRAPLKEIKEAIDTYRQ